MSNNIFFCNSKLFEFFKVIFRRKQFHRQLLGMNLSDRLKYNIRYFFACLNFELTNLKDLWSKVAALCRKHICTEAHGKYTGTVTPLC